MKDKAIKVVNHKLVGVFIGKAVPRKDDTEIPFTPKPIEYIGIVKVKKPNPFTKYILVGSEDGKEYKLLVGLYVDGQMVDARKAKQVFRFLEEDENK